VLACNRGIKIHAFASEVTRDLTGRRKSDLGVSVLRCGSGNIRTIRAMYLSLLSLLSFLSLFLLSLSLSLSLSSFFSSRANVPLRDAPVFVS